MSAKVYENGAWRDVKGARVFENGAWRDVKQGNIYENGAWRKVYPELAVDVADVSVSDEVIVPHAVYGDMPFIVIGKNHDANNSVTLLTKEIVDLLIFDKEHKAMVRDTQFVKDLQEAKELTKRLLEFK